MNYKINKIKSPLSVQFELTYDCNNRCGFCYNVNKSPDNSEKKSELERIFPFEKVTIILDKLQEAEIFELVLTGGEPTIHPDFFKILKYAGDIGFQTSFITNANTATSAFVDTVHELGVNGVQVSLHGSNRELHEGITLVDGSFEKALAGIRNYISSSFYVNVNMTVCKNNIDDIVHTAGLVKELGCDSFTISRFVASGDGLVNNDTIGITKADLNYLVDQLERVEKEVGIEFNILTPIPFCSIDRPEVIIGKMARCDGGISWAGVSPTGKVRFCTHSSEIAGDLMSDSLENIWQNGNPFVRCQSLENVPDECKGCAAFQFCGGGCRSHSLNCTGDYKGFDSCATIENIEALNKRMPALIEEMNVKNRIKLNTYDTNISILLQKPYVDSSKVHFRDEWNETLSFNGESCQKFNNDAMAIFELCTGELTVREIIERLSLKFEQPFDELKPIIVEFMDSSTMLKILSWKAFDYTSIELAKV